MAVNFEPLLNVTEAAGLLRIHPKTLRVKARSGEDPGNSNRQSVEISCIHLNRWAKRAEDSHSISVG